MGKAHEQTFPQQRYTNAPKIHEKMFTIFVEMQIKTMKYHFIPIRIAIKQTKLEKKKNTYSWEFRRNWNPSYTVDQNVKWYNYCGKQFNGPFKC